MKVSPHVQGTRAAATSQGRSRSWDSAGATTTGTIPPAPGGLGTPGLLSLHGQEYLQLGAFGDLALNNTKTLPASKTVSTQPRCCNTTGFWCPAPAPPAPTFPKSFHRAPTCRTEPISNISSGRVGRRWAVPAPCFWWKEVGAEQCRSSPSPSGRAGGAGSLIGANLIRLASALCPVTWRHNEIIKCDNFTPKDY